MRYEEELLTFIEVNNHKEPEDLQIALENLQISLRGVGAV